MAENKEILEKMSEIGDQIKHVQEKQTSLKGDFDGADFANMKKNAEEAAKKFEDAQIERQKVEEENKERIFGIEKAVASMSPKAGTEGLELSLKVN